VGTDAGLLAPTENIGAFAEALARVIGDARLRAQLADGARQARERLRNWEQALEEMTAALRRLDTPAGQAE